MKLILDFIPNYTSNKHPWFLNSSESDTGNYSDYYIWRDGKNGGSEPPNNWLNFYGESAWTKDDTRNQYYLHQFLKEQPDLNLRNPEVLKEMEDILNFWLDKKVDGFRVIAAPYLVEDSSYEDEPNSDAVGTGHESLSHVHTMYTNETLELLIKWKQILEKKTSADPNYYRAMIAEASGNVDDFAKLYEYNNTKVCDMPIYKNLFIGKDMNAKDVMGAIMNVIDSKIKDEGWYSWVLDDSEHRRTAAAAESNIDVVNMIHLLLPGTPFLYYGSEIGMQNGVITEMVDILGKTFGSEQGRDPQRTPMQWNNELNAGFSSNDKTWLPVNNDYEKNNVKAQLAHGIETSHIEVVMNIAKLKSEPSIQWGEFVKIDLQSDSVFAFVRQAIGFDGYLVVVNYGPDDDVVDLSSNAPTHVPGQGTIVATTLNFDSHVRAEDFKVGTSVQLDNIHLRKGEGVVFNWPAKDIPSE